MIREFLKRIRIAGTAPGTPPGRPAQGLARDLLKLQMGGPPGAGDQALGILLLRDPPQQQKSPGPRRAPGTGEKRPLSRGVCPGRKREA